MNQSSSLIVKIAGLSLISGLILALCSCDSGKKPQPDKQELRDIQVMASDGWIYDVMGETARLFEEETGIEVSFTIYAPHIYFRALQTRLASGEATDIFLMQSTRWLLGNEIDPVANCLDFTDEEWTSRLKPEWLPAVTYQGRIYGLVVWDDTVGWVYTYNDAIFKQLGLSSPKNTREFFEVCERILQAGIVPIYEPGASRWHSALTFFEMGAAFEENDPGLYDRLNANDVTFAGYPPFHEALEQILSAVRKGYFGDDFLANTIEGSKSALASREAAMTLDKIGFARSVLKGNPDAGSESWGMIPIPWMDNRTVSIERSAPTWFGNSRSRDKDAVLQFFRFMTRPDNLERYAQGQPEGIGLSFPTAPVPLLPNEQEFLETASLGGEPFQGGVKYIMTQWMELDADFEQMLIGVLTPLEYLARVDERRANMAIAAGDPAWAYPTVDSVTP
jgi:raffinose/stachyose/melibiose transport system substrate-binding protein